MQKNGLNKISNVKASVYLVFASLLWGTSFPAIKLGLNQNFSPIWFLFLRNIISLFLAIILFQKFIKVKELLKKSVIFLGLFNALAYLFQFVGQKYTYSSNAVLIVHTLFVSVAIISYLFLKEEMGIQKILALIFAFIGIFTVSTQGSMRISSVSKGDLILLGAPLFWGAFIVLSKKLLNEGESEEFLLVAITFWTTVFLLPSIFFVKPDFSSNIVLLSLYLAFFCSILPFIIYLKALNVKEPTTASLWTLLEVLFGIVFSVILLKEKIGFYMVVGGAFIGAGILLAEKKKGKIE